MPAAFVIFYDTFGNMLAPFWVPSLASCFLPCRFFLIRSENSCTVFPLQSEKNGIPGARTTPYTKPALPGESTATAFGSLLLWLSFCGCPTHTKKKLNATNKKTLSGPENCPLFVNWPRNFCPDYYCGTL